jgi:ribosomal protein S18 acetylase RimI-like enzyme
MPGLSIQVETLLSRADRRRVLDELIAYNVAAAGPVVLHDIFVALRKHGELNGACIGRALWGWLYVEMLWIASDLRRRGYGKMLLDKAENEARDRGCKHVFLDTFSFQAPEFYRKLGYAEFGRLSDNPQGHARIFMTKSL